MAPDIWAERLAMIARDIRADRSVAQTAEYVCAAAVDLIPKATGAGITLVRGRRELETVGATDDVVRAGDRLQYELGEGPCIEATWEDQLVHAPTLATDHRWPRWAPRVVAELGFESIVCVQLFTHEDQIGALNVYSRDPHAFAEEDRDVARLLAAHGAAAVAGARQIETLKVAVDRRTTVGKAVGIVMARYELDDVRAFDVLRRLSSHQNRKLHDVALEVIEHLRIPEDPSARNAGGSATAE
jgi:GAF domain-containing protein